MKYQPLSARLIVTLIAALALVVQTVTAAAPTTTLVPVPISAAALAADPTLANYRSFDLRVNIDPGHTWSATGFTVRLNGGLFYNPPFGTQGPQPHLWEVFPQLRYDTFITHAARPDDPSTYAMPLIHGGYPNQLSPPVFNDTEISLIYTWTAAQSSGPGTFTVARLTVANGAFGTMIGESHQYNPQLTTTEILPFNLILPEPAGAAAVGSLVAVVLARRGARRLASTRA